MIFTFACVSCVLFLFNFEFIPISFIVIYVGAIAVLFLFVVMMLNIKLVEINENVLRYLPIGGLIGLIFLFEVFLIVDSDLIPMLHLNPQFSLSGDFTMHLGQLAVDSFFIQWPTLINSVSNIESVGQLIYTYYFYYFI